MDYSDFNRPPPEAWHYVDDASQAELLADPKSLRYFGPFIGQEKSAKAAAAEVGVSVALMLYHLKRFLRTGLLIITRTESRPGRPIKHYRAVKDGFYVPLAATLFADEEERLQAYLKRRHDLTVSNAARLLREAGREGRRIFRAANGEIVTESAGGVISADPFNDPSGPAAIDFDLDVRLTTQEAKALQKELYALMERYQHPGREGKRYLLAVTLMPLAE